VAVWASGPEAWRLEYMGLRRFGRGGAWGAGAVGLLGGSFNWVGGLGLAVGGALGGDAAGASTLCSGGGAVGGALGSDAAGASTFCSGAVGSGTAGLGLAVARLRI
jgi:hypothetical protein